jgi:hypothetical protein
LSLGPAQSPIPPDPVHTELDTAASVKSLGIKGQVSCFQTLDLTSVHSSAGNLTNVSRNQNQTYKGNLGAVILVLWEWVRGYLKFYNSSLIQIPASPPRQDLYLCKFVFPPRAFLPNEVVLEDGFENKILYFGKA